jgi:RNA polymerase sigma-70 factor (ECF subfamily)
MNTCITYLRQSYTEPLTIPLTTDIAERFADQEEKAEQLRELYLLISQLGKLERALILLWLDERSYQEMADILGISKASIAVKLHRVKEKLKKMSNS